MRHVLALSPCAPSYSGQDETSPDGVPDLNFRHRFFVVSLQMLRCLALALENLRWYDIECEADVTLEHPSLVLFVFDVRELQAVGRVVVRRPRPS